MRKVKVLAFVLAALMVVAAFAGCGTKQLKTDVSTLDERVTALENLLKQVNDTVSGAATADQVNKLLDEITANKAEAAAGDKTLADAIAKITADQATANAALKADLEKLVDAAKKDQAAGDAALQAAIEKLNNSIDATNKALADAVKDLEGDITAGDKATLDAVKALLEEQNKDIADALKELSDKIAADNKVQTDLDTAKNNYTGKLEILKGQLDANSNLYSATEYTTIATALITGVANIKNAATVEEVVKFYTDAEKVYNDCTPLSIQLENAYNNLLGEVTNSDATKKAVEAYKKLADAATKLYGATGKEVIIGEGDKAINLVSYYSTLKAAYDKAVALAKDAKALDDAIKAIKKVYVVEGAYYTGTTTTKFNLDKVNAATSSYNSYANEVTKGTYKALFDHEAMLALVTRKAELDGYNADKVRLQTAIANYTWYGELDGASYKDIFAEYDVAKSDIEYFDKVATVYDVIDARIADWADDYSVDSENLAAVINASKKDASFYTTYTTNNDYAHRFLAKYNEFVADFATRVKTLNKIEKFTNADVAELVAIEKALYDDKTGWVVTILREKTDKVDEYKVNLEEYEDGVQLKAMLKKALEREELFKFKADSKAETFYTTTFDQAKTVAAAINAEIKSLVDNKGTILSLLDFKTLNNFVPVTGGYKEDATTTYTVENLFDGTDVVDDISIYMFKKVFVTSDYDLTNLLNLADFEAAEAVVAARIAELKVVTDKIVADRKAVVNALKDKKVVNVSLNNETTVNDLWSTYKTLSANGFQPNETFAWVYDSEAKIYKNVLLLTDDVIYDLTYLKARIDVLRTFADNLVKTFETLATANGFDKFDAKDGLTAPAKVKNDPTYDKNGNWEADHFTTITAIDEYTGKVTTAQDAASSMSQAAAVKAAYAAYKNFIAENSKSAASGKVTTYAAVENALMSYNFDALKLAVVKMHAYAEVVGISEDEAKAAGWDETVDQDFTTHKNMQLAIITDAVDKNAVAVNLKHFYDLTEVKYEGFSVFGDTFGFNGLIVK